MALCKTIYLPSNVSACYWKIVQTNINWLTHDAQVVLAGYINAEARVSGAAPVSFDYYDWRAHNFPFDINVLDEPGFNVLKLAYIAIKNYVTYKSDPETGELVSVRSIFSDAEDC